MAASLGVSGMSSSLVVSSAIGSQLVQMGSCSEICDSQRRREAANKEVKESTALEAVTRQQMKTQQAEKTLCVL
jgi:hypothetical protein